MNQRRCFVRVAVALDVELGTHVEDVVGAAAEGREWFQISARTVNLSGGGFAIRHSHPLPPGSLFDVSLRLPTRDEPLNLVARAVRAEFRDTFPEEMKYDIGFAFVDPPEVLRRIIISFVIRLQQQYLQNE
jgi:c-di-GMP-binding flagellar brake protein YcgR